MTGDRLVHSNDITGIFSQIQIPTRETLIGELRNVKSGDKITVTAAEKSHIATLMEDLPPEKWKEFAVSWMRALQANRTPLDYTNGAVVEKAGFKFRDKRYPLSRVRGGSYESRHQEIRKREPYAAAKQSGAYEFSVVDDCPLCEIIKQSEDARDSGKATNDTVMLRVRDYLLVANRFPQTRLHSLFASGHHDDAVSRAPCKFTAFGDRRIVECSRVPEKTRGRVPAADELYILFGICNELNLAARRNHVLDGMSVPGHDHWHLKPVQFMFPEGIFEALTDERLPNEGVSTALAHNTPFELLMLRSTDLALLAKETSRLIRAMENEDQIYCLSYNSGTVFVSPRKDSDKIVISMGIGSGLAHMQFNPENQDECTRAVEFVPLRGEFDWARFGIQAY